MALGKTSPTYRRLRRRYRLRFTFGMMTVFALLFALAGLWPAAFHVGDAPCGGDDAAAETLLNGFRVGSIGDAAGPAFDSGLSARAHAHVPASASVAAADDIVIEDVDDLDQDEIEEEHVSVHSNGMLIELTKSRRCESFINLPGVNVWPRGGRVFLYFVALCYSFLGIAIVADVFMSAIEVITSKEKEVSHMADDGTVHVETVLVWNETVANLTLMALGSSAPEILLAVIETVGTLTTEPGELGPSTIVGSAAFNLLAIIAVCIVGIPEGEVRRIKDLGVFAVTAFFSIFAYIWMLVVLRWHSENVVQIGEALLTLGFFPVLVVLAFGADRGWFGGKGDAGARQRLAGLTEEEEKDLAEQLRYMAMVKGGEGRGVSDKVAKQEAVDEVARAMVSHAKPRASKMKYRINAVRGLGGGKRVVAGEEAKTHSLLANRANQKKYQLDDEKFKGYFQFGAPTYSVNESDGKIAVEIQFHHALPALTSGGENETFSVEYETHDGTATAPDDYQARSGVLTFSHDETSKTIDVPIMDDDLYEGDEVFYVLLKNPSEGTTIGPASLCAITIIDDDEPGFFSFNQRSFTTREDHAGIEIGVSRFKGADGKCTVRYHTIEGTAKEGSDFIPTSGVLEFDHGETTKSFKVEVIVTDEVEKDETFYVVLENPTNGAKLGDVSKATITITQKDEYRALVQAAEAQLRNKLGVFSVGTSSWTQQFIDAMSISGEVDDEGNELPPSKIDFFMHFLTFLWKVIFACIPPTDILGGWLTFFVSLVGVGALTAIVGELASLFGCAIGLKDSVTAITFVALGTSLPDMFASKQAAAQEDTADTAIGNVTGSNGVNVFLGLGLPWTIASIYHKSNGTVYNVPAGDLSFSVLVFALCAVIAISTLMLRRKIAGGELGGPKGLRYFSAGLFIFLWFLYVLLSALSSYGHIESF